MPKSKPVETFKEPEICILRMGKHNNFVQWKESMYNLATELFGEVGTYLHTNSAYRYVYYVEPVIVAPVEPAAAVDEDDDEEDDDDEEEDVGEVVVPPVVLPPLAPPDALPAATQLAPVNKLREGAYEARRKREEAAVA
jgi:hypothetical protein